MDYFVINQSITKTSVDNLFSLPQSFHVYVALFLIAAGLYMVFRGVYK